MKPTWLIERGVYGEDAEVFSAEVKRQGMQCVEVDYQPGKSPPSDILGFAPPEEHACIVLWGTLPLMRQIQLYRTWAPGGWCNTCNLDCSAYYAHFGAFLLNDYYTILPGVEAVRLRDRLYGEFGIDDEVFVRPSCVHKLFTGRVVYRDDFRAAIAPSLYDPMTLLIVSLPKTVRREWRLVVAEGGVVAASLYRDNGVIRTARGCPTEVSQFAADVLQTAAWSPDPVFMMDVCD